MDGVDGGRDESHETECASESSPGPVMGIAVVVVRHEILQRIQEKHKKSAVKSWTEMS